MDCFFAVSDAVLLIAASPTAFGMENALVDLIEATLMEMYNTSMTDAEMLEELLQRGL